MQKIFTIFLLAATMCVSSIVCSNVPASTGPSPVVIEIGDEDVSTLPMVLSIGDMDALETTAPTKDIQAEVWDEDYMALMVESCLNGDVESGRRAESDRNAKIAALGLDVPEIGFDDLYELSKIITNEAGSYWLPMDWKMMVGEVVLNRVASVEFPNTIAEVVHQRGQYSGANSKRFEELVPFADCVEAARRLLSGERPINDPSVVFQSNYRQGSGTCLRLYDSHLGYTYLCYSNYPELYQTDE